MWVLRVRFWSACLFSPAAGTGLQQTSTGALSVVVSKVIALHCHHSCVLTDDSQVSAQPGAHVTSLRGESSMCSCTHHTATMQLLHVASQQAPFHLPWPRKHAEASRTARSPCPAPTHAHIKPLPTYSENKGYT